MEKLASLNVIIVGLVLGGAVVLGYAPANAGGLGNKRDFRGINCGSGPTREMVKKADAYDEGTAERWWQEGVEGSDWREGVIEYARRGEKLAVGKVALSEVLYFFYKGRFLGGVLVPSPPCGGIGEDHPTGPSKGLKEDLVFEFGEPVNEHANFVGTDWYWYKWGGQFMRLESLTSGPSGVCTAEFVCVGVLEEKNQEGARLFEDLKRREAAAAREQRRDALGVHPDDF